MTLHFPDQTPTNVLTIEATDPIAGTADSKRRRCRSSQSAPRQPSSSHQPRRRGLAERSGRGRGRLMVGEAPTPAQGATAEERAVVDETLLGFREFERSSLLPLLQAVQTRQQPLSKGLLGYLGERVRVPFAELYGVATFYALLPTDRPAPDVRLCSGVPCVLAGAEGIADALSRAATIDWAWFPCIGQCDRAPAALVGEDARYHLRADTALDQLDASD